MTCKIKPKYRFYIVTSYESRWIKAQSREDAIARFNHDLGHVTEQELEVQDLGEA